MTRSDTVLLTYGQKPYFLTIEKSWSHVRRQGRGEKGRTKHMLDSTYLLNPSRHSLQMTRVHSSKSSGWYAWFSHAHLILTAVM